jgi:hypothetical protein
MVLGRSLVSEPAACAAAATVMQMKIVSHSLALRRRSFWVTARYAVKVDLPGPSLFSGEVLLNHFCFNYLFEN